MSAVIFEHGSAKAASILRSKDARSGSRPSSRPFTANQDRLITILAERGFTVAEAAEHLDRHHGTIIWRSRLLGVKFCPKSSRSWVGFLTSELSP